MEKIAIVGAGPAGLVAARYLRSEGFEPVLFEQGDRVGGQWTGDPRYSGVWPSMRTNTSRVMSAFSDLEHPPGTAVYPTNQEMCAYFQRYAERFRLESCVRLSTTVLEIRRDRGGPGWVVRFVHEDGVPWKEPFSKVVIASGRFRKPRFPAIPGLASFAGIGGVTHTFYYKDPRSYRGLRVLVAGCSISALEVASDLAMVGAARVISTNRRQRYVIQKVVAGVPADHIAFTRFGALAGESLPKETTAQRIKDFILRASGSPEQVGAGKPADDIFEAGIALSQHYLPLVAEGRIITKPWIDSIAGRTVRFADGTQEEVDAILLGTGYEVDLPFLCEEVRRALDPDSQNIDLYKHTFHPDLEGLAFIGAVDVMGPNFTVLELQARWIAYVWSGALPALSSDAMWAGIAALRAQRNGQHQVPMNVAALLFAREAGVEPDLQRWPELARALLFGPLTAVSFRLDGRDALPDAPQRVAQDAATFRAVPSTVLTPEERSGLEALASARNEPVLTQLVQRLASA
ncbi:MAG TPA: NAD(P)-binding domain-containing protein [Thermoanaerobaculaceae bacterium]|nr:NAD(P)-binding domain-containing protein [Thermoanaerobaculaceae bacterium]